MAGIVNPINPLLEAEQISAILRETKAKVVVTLRAFPKTDVPQKVAEAVRHAPSVKTVLEVDLVSYLTPPKSWIVRGSSIAVSCQPRVIQWAEMHRTRRGRGPRSSSSVPSTCQLRR